jgi:mannose-6-phosphate isomerase
MTRHENIAQSQANLCSLQCITRHWGKVEVLEKGSNYRINRIEIKPKHSIKQQIHYHRCEHWVVVSGTAKVTCGNQELLLNRNESTFVPSATFHRVENPGFIPLIILEIQNGEYLGEDDTGRSVDLTAV